MQKKTWPDADQRMETAKYEKSFHQTLAAAPSLVAGTERP